MKTDFLLRFLRGVVPQRSYVQKATRRRTASRSCSVEQLEQRLCLSSVSFAANNGVLTVRGTAESDDIALLSGSTIEIAANGLVTDTGFDPSAISQLIVLAGGGNDRVEIQSSLRIPARLVGADGDDTLIGSSGADVLIGNAGSDSLSGNAGDDYLLIDQDDTDVAGDAGRDRVNARASLSGVNLNLAAASIELAYGSDFDDFITAEGLPERAYIYGYGGNDTLIGSDFNDLILGYDGDDDLSGRGGNDNLIGHAGVDALRGESGDDNLQIDSDDVAVDGGEGRDRANARRSEQGVTIDLAVGSIELAYGSDFDDFITAEGLPERAYIYGYGGNDTLIGSDFNDLILGYDGDDDLSGRGGNDNLIGYAGADALRGESGDDNLQIDGNDVTVDGGEGRDRANARRSEQGVTIDLAAGSIEIAYGSDFDDFITAEGLPERAYIYGYGGNDTLIGSEFNDLILGYDGDDDLSGRGGNDNLIGHAGADAVRGESGDDNLQIDGNDVTVDGGEGRDRANARRSEQAVTIDLAGASVETYYGSDLSDTVYSLESTGTARIYSYGGGNNLWVSPRTDGSSIVALGRGADRLHTIEPADAESTDSGGDSGRVTTSGDYGDVIYRQFSSTQIVDRTERPAYTIRTLLGEDILDNDVLNSGIVRMPAVQLTGGRVSVQIHNSSSEPLEIHDFVAFGDFRVVLQSKTSFEGEGESEPLFPRVVEPGSTFALELAYRDPQPGRAYGTLRIETNDDQRPVTVVPIGGEVLYEPDVQILAGPSGVKFDDPSQIIDFGTFPSGEIAFIPLSITNYEYQVVTVDPAEGASTAGFYFRSKGGFEDESGTSDPVQVPADATFRLTDTLGLNPGGRPFVFLDLGIDQPATFEAPGIVRINRTDGEPLEFHYVINFAPPRDVFVRNDLGEEIFDGERSDAFGALSADPTNESDKLQSFTIVNRGSEAQTVNSVTVTGDFELASASLPQILGPNETASFTVRAIPPSEGERLNGGVTVQLENADDYDFLLTATLDEETILEGVLVGSDHDHVPAHAFQSSLEEGGAPIVRTELAPAARRWYLFIRNETDQPQALQYKSDISGLRFLEAPASIEPGGVVQVVFDFPVDPETNRVTGYVQVQTADGLELPLRAELDFSFREKGGFEE